MGRKRIEPVPKPGEVWRSRDPRDHGLKITVLDVDEKYVYIKRFNKTRVRRDRFRKDYAPSA